MFEGWRRGTWRIYATLFAVYLTACSMLWDACVWERERQNTNHWWFHYFHSSLLSSWVLDHCCRLLQSCGITPWLTVSIKALWSLRRVVEHLNDSPDLLKVIVVPFHPFQDAKWPLLCLSFVLVAYVFNSFVLSCVEVHFPFSVPKDSTVPQDKY